MSTLHTVNKSPFEKSSLESCIRLMQTGSTLLLIEDAVVAAVAGTAVEAMVRAALERGKVCCLQPDLLARGLGSNATVAGVELVSYEGFVSLAVEHDRVQSWL